MFFEPRARAISDRHKIQTHSHLRNISRIGRMLMKFEIPLKEKIATAKHSQDINGQIKITRKKKDQPICMGQHSTMNFYVDVDDEASPRNKREEKKKQFQGKLLESRKMFCDIYFSASFLPFL